MHIIAGKLKGKRLVTPKGEATRPTSGALREALFNICQLYIEGAHFLDLFAGTGAMGFEALSRGAAQATFVDQDREALQSIQKNIELLHVENQAHLLYGDVFSVLERLSKQGKQFDIIYADPPYGASTTEKRESPPEFYSTKVIHWIDQSNLLKKGGMLFIEETKEASEDEETLARLQLKSSRKMGRSVLRQYFVP